MVLYKKPIDVPVSWLEKFLDQTEEGYFIVAIQE